MTLDEYIEKTWNRKRLNEYSYSSGWHDDILDIIREVWQASREETIDLLRSIEFNNDVDNFCPKCGFASQSGHDKGCQLNAIINNT